MNNREQSRVDVVGRGPPRAIHDLRYRRSVSYRPGFTNCRQAHHRSRPPGVTPRGPDGCTGSRDANRRRRTGTGSRRRKASRCGLGPRQPNWPEGLRASQPGDRARHLRPRRDGPPVHSRAGLEEAGRAARAARFPWPGLNGSDAGEHLSSVALLAAVSARTPEPATEPTAPLSGTTLLKRLASGAPPSLADVKSGAGAAHLDTEPPVPRSSGRADRDGDHARRCAGSDRQRDAAPVRRIATGRWRQRVPAESRLREMDDVARGCQSRFRTQDSRAADTQQSSTSPRILVDSSRATSSGTVRCLRSSRSSR